MKMDSGNPADPDASETVTRGPQTDDEMLLDHVDDNVPKKDMLKVQDDLSDLSGSKIRPID